MAIPADPTLPPGGTFDAEGADWVQRYLQHAQVEKRLAERTLVLYTLDLKRLTELCARDGLTLRNLQPTHVRRWVAQMHSAGRSARGIALILSGWRAFYTWLGREGHPSGHRQAGEIGQGDEEEFELAHGQAGAQALPATPADSKLAISFMKFTAACTSG